MEPDDSGTSAGEKTKQPRTGRRKFMAAAGAGTVAGLAGCMGGGDNGDTNTPTESSGGGDTDTATPTSTSTGSYKVGLLGPGLNRSPIGISMRAAAEIGAAEANAEHDFDVEIVSRDTQENTQVAQTVYRELVEDEGVDVTVGIFRSEILLSLLDSIAESGVPHLIGGSAASQATQAIAQDYDTYRPIFRVGPVNDVYIGKSIIDFASDAFVNQLGWDKIGIMMEDLAWTQQIDRVWRGEYPGFDGFSNLDVEVVDFVRYPVDTEDFSSYYTDFAEQGVDGVVPAMTSSGNAAIINWAQGEFPFGFGGVHVPMQLPQYYAATDGATRYGFTQNFGASGIAITDKTIPFVESFREQTNSDPVYTGFATYDATKMWAQTLAENGSAAPDDMIPALEQQSYIGASGTIEFYGKDQAFPHDLKYGEEFVYPVYLQWQEVEGVGKQEAIWPRDIQTAEYETPAWF